MRDDFEPLTVKIPANIDQADKVVYQLSVRQVVILAVTGLVASGLYLATITWLPIPAVVAAVFPVIAAGVVLAVARRDGMSLDAFAFAAFAHLRSVKTQVAAPEGVQAPPGWCRIRGRLPAPLTLPVRAVRDDGVLELADGGTAVIVQAGTVSFGLRTAAEQAGLVAAFGRWLNSLDGSAQILVQARPVDLTGLADHLAEKAPHLADPALEAAALDHAAFLADLSTAHDLLGRRVLIVLRDVPQDRPSGPVWNRRRSIRQASASVVVRRAEEAVRALNGLGVTAAVLDAAACTVVLAESLSPGQPQLAGAAQPRDLITSPEANR